MDRQERQVAAAALALLLLTGAAPPAAGAASFTSLTRVHVQASEELDPDVLRALARRSVVLWLSTRTNTLRASTIDTLNRFTEAWVQLRAPVNEADARQLLKVPAAGLWLDFKDLDGARRVLGPRRLAVKLDGPLDEAIAEKLQRLRGAEVSWAAPSEVDLLSWSLFRQLPGRKILRRGAAEPWPTQCPAGASPAEPALRTRLELITALEGTPFPCGAAPRVEVPLGVDRAAIEALLVRFPSAELVVEVGEDPVKASKARRLLDALGLK